MNKINPLLFVTICISLCSCSSRGLIWDMEIENFRERVESGDTEFLKGLDYNKLDIAELKKLGAGGAYLMSFHYSGMGMEEISMDLLEIERKGEESIWSREAEKLLLQEYLRAGELKKTENLAVEILKEGSRNDINEILAEAYYRQQRDKELLGLLESVPDLPDRDLLTAVSSCRLNLPFWERKFLLLFSKQTLPDIITRAFDFLTAQPGRVKNFTDDEFLLLKGRNLIARKEYAEGISLLTSYIKAVPAEKLTREILESLKTGIRFTGNFLGGAAGMDTLLGDKISSGDTVSSELIYAFYDVAGWLYRRAGRYNSAALRYRSALETAPESLLERTHWYLFDCIVKKSPAEAVKHAEEFLPRWKDGDYFSDALEVLATELVKRRDWNGIWRMYRYIDGFADPYVLARYGYISARAFEEGLFLPEEDVDQATHSLVSETPVSMYERIKGLDPYGYYGILCAYKTGGKPGITEFGIQETEEHTNGELSEYLNGFIRYNLVGEALDFVKNWAGPDDYGALRKLSEKLGESGNIYDSIIISKRAAKNSSGIISRGDAELIYPFAFREGIEKVCTAEDIYPPLFAALIREESYFSPAIVSWAGAVGLCQLMPATALEVAGRIGIKDPELTDPAVNLAIGSWYFGYLKNRTDNISEVLAAYNGGIGRVGRWKREHGELPDDLFAESIELTETRNYLRKVLVSGEIYRYLYGDTDSPEIVKLFYPEFGKI